MGRTQPVLEDMRAGSAETVKRKEGEAATVKQFLGDFSREAEANKVARTAAQPVAPDLTKPPSTQARAFLEPGPSLLGQVQTIMQGIGTLALGMAGAKGRGYAIAG